MLFTTDTLEKKKAVKKRTRYVFILCVLWILKLIISIRKSLPCQDSHLSSISEWNLWIIVGVTDTKLDQLQYFWRWLRGVKWGMEKCIWSRLIFFFHQCSCVS